MSNASTPSSLTTPSLSTTGPEPVVDSKPDLMESDAFDKYVDDLIDYSKTGYRRESGNRFHPEDVEPYTGPHGRPLPINLNPFQISMHCASDSAKACAALLRLDA